MSDERQRIMIPRDHIHQRTQGCWNCKHCVSGNALWKDRRQSNLRIALSLAKDSPMGENDQRVYNIRNMVNKLDHAVAQGVLKHCTGKGVTATGDDVGEFVMHNFLCHKWDAAEGASLARDIGKTDKLPEEIAADLDGIPNLEELLAEKARLEKEHKP